LVPSAAQAIKKAKKLVKRKQTLKFTVDCSQPVDDGIMDAASFVRAPQPPSRDAGLVSRTAGGTTQRGPLSWDTILRWEGDRPLPYFPPQR